MSVNGLLDERQVTHGNFSDNARNGQAIRALFRSSPAWESMPEIHREALDMIAGKLARILSGQSTWGDHFADIAGYAELARRACPEPPKPLGSLSTGFMDNAGNWVNAPYEA